MAITFAVDDVPPASEPPASRSLREHLGRALAVGGDPDPRVLAVDGAHALLGAVHHAFAAHRPLTLTPDAVWLTISQGVAHHVGLNAEALRGRLGVRHQGKERIEILTDEPIVPSRLPGLVTALRAELGKRIGEGRARLFTFDFATTTEVDRTASEMTCSLPTTTTPSDASAAFPSSRSQARPTIGAQSARIHLRRAQLGAARGGRDRRDLARRDPRRSVGRGRRSLAALVRPLARLTPSSASRAAAENAARGSVVPGLTGAHEDQTSVAAFMAVSAP